MNLKDLTLYIAGPMTGLPDNNKPAFIEAERALNEAGYSNVINPARFAEHTQWQPADYIRRAAAIVGSGAVDGLALLPGWRLSNGTMPELNVASALDLELWEIEDLL